MSEKTKTCFTISSCLRLLLIAMGRMTSSKTATKFVFIDQKELSICLTFSTRPRESVGPPTAIYVGVAENVMKPPPKGGFVTSETRRERPIEESMGTVPSLNRGEPMLPLTSQIAIEESKIPESFMRLTRVFHWPSIT